MAKHLPLVVALAVSASLAAAQPAGAVDDVGSDGVLHVCADPNNLPLSHRQQTGYENKIAQLLARELGWKLEYTWFPQRIGFIRNTLTARDPYNQRYKCDLVMGVPVGYGLTATTIPYYHSVYALAYVKGRGLDAVHSLDDLLRLPPDKLRSLRFGAFGRTPPIDWLQDHGLMDQLVPYQTQTGDPDQYPGEIIEKDLAAGKIDVAFVWGPIAGYFGKKTTSVPVTVVPFPPNAKYHYDYRIAMGTRFADKAWNERLDRLIEKDRAEIQEILAGYDVPMLDDAGRPLHVSAVAPSTGKP